MTDRELIDRIAASVPLPEPWGHCYVWRAWDGICKSFYARRLGERGNRVILYTTDEVLADRRACIAAALESDQSWRNAVIDACVILFLDWDENNPRETISRLIEAETAIALDPAVSERAAALAHREPVPQQVLSDAAFRGMAVVAGAYQDDATAAWDMSDDTLQKLCRAIERAVLERLRANTRVSGPQQAAHK
jgi:hypothetical protein